MPYFTKKGTGKDKGKTCVHKKSSKKKVGCTSGPIEKYLTALRMAESKEDPLKWIKDVKTNNDIAKELYDGLEWYKEENIDFVRNQWNGIPFSVRPFEKGRDKIILSPSSFHVNYRKYMIENLGIYEMDNAKEIYFLLRKLIAQKIHNNLNESKDFEWTDSTSDRPLHNVTFKVKGYPETLYTIKDSGLRSSVKIKWVTNAGFMMDGDWSDGIKEESTYMRDAVNKYFKIGEWIPTEGPITESKDLDWIEDVTPRMDATLLKPGQRFYDKWGDIIRVLEYLGRDDEGEGEICYEPPCTLLRFRKIKDPSGYRPYPGVPMSHPLNTDMVFTPNDFNNYIDNGKLKLINIDNYYYESLNESDLDWIKDIKPEGLNKNNSYVVDVRGLRPETPISISPTSPEYTELTKEDILNELKDLGYDVEDVDLNRAAFFYIEPSADAGYWDGPVWVEQQYWVDYDEDNIEDPTYGGKYKMIDVDELMILIDNNLISESTDFDWVDGIPKDYYPPDLESGLKGLEKWAGQAYQTDDEIGLSVQDVKENPNKENIQDLINVLKHWKPYHDGDEVYWAVEDLISSINPFRFKDLNNMGLFESDLNWVSDTTNKVQTTGVDHDGNIISLQKVYFDFLSTIAKVEGNYNPRLESNATLDTKYTIKVKDYLNLDSRTYQGLGHELLLIGLDKAFKMYFDKKPTNTLTEAAGISFEARKWGEIIYNEIINNPDEKKRLIIDGYDHPEAFNGFPIDYVVIDFYDKLTGYGQEHSGYDKDGNYVVLLYVQPKLLQGQGGYSLKSALNHEMKHAWDDYNRLSKGLPSIDNTKETKELYNKDFILMLSDQNVRGPIKELLKYYYYLSKLETTAYLENVYDNNPVYEKIVREIASKDFESFKDRFDLDINWHLMNTAYDIPFLKKFKSPKEFIDYSSEELSSKAIKMIKKINKMKYIHKKL